MRRAVSVIGAGPGGLAAAMLLAKAGVDVTVHEARDVIGGRSSTITGATPQGTFRFDTGPTFFLYPRVLADIFAACGRSLEDEVELIRLDPQYHLVFEGGGEIQATGDMGGWRQRSRGSRWPTRGTSTGSWTTTGRSWRCSGRCWKVRSTGCATSCVRRC